MMLARYNTHSLIRYFDRCSPWLRYGAALLAVATAAIATLAIPAIGERAAFLLYFFAIFQASFWLGFRPGLVALVLSLVAVNALALFPVWQTRPYDALILTACFCAVSATMIATTGFHRQLATTLRENKQDLDHAQAVGQIGSWRLNVQRNELRWSDENYRIFGIPNGTPLNYETFLAIVHPDDRDYVDRMWQAAQRGEPYDIEHRLMVAGAVKWVREKAILEFGDNGVLLAGFGITQDITTQKRNEQALADSRQRYADIVESALDAIIVINTDHRIVLFNAAAEKMFGCSASLALGGPVLRFIPGRFHAVHDGYICAFENIGAAVRQMAITGLRANGEEFPIEASISKAGAGREKLFTAILRDISERVQAEIALRERLSLQDQLAKVAATAPGVICSFRLRPDGSASMPYASPVFESVYGLSLATVAEDFSPVFARIHGDDIGAIHETIAESARTMQPWRGIFRYRHPTKGEIWIEGHSIPLREQDGSILWHGYVQDVTERKQVADAIHTSEAFVRDVLNALPEHVAVLDDAGIVIAVNEPWERFAMEHDGSLRAVSVGADYLAVCRRASSAGDPHAGRAFEGLAALLAGQRQDFVMEYPYITFGRKLWFFMHAKRVVHGFHGVIISHVDITEHKRAETALHAAEARLALVVKTVQAGYWDWDLVAQQLYLSPEWKRQLGFDEDGLPDRWQEWERRLHPDDRATVLAATDNFIAGRQPDFELEFRLQHQDGSYRWVHSRGALLRDANKQPYRMLGINLDITDYKQAMELNAQRNRMEQSLRWHVAAQTAAAIAHELNQPLTAIAAYADVALQLLNTGNQNPQKLSYAIENCAVQAQRAGQAMRQLLALLHKSADVSEPMDLNASVRETLELIKASGCLGIFKIELELSADLPPVIANNLHVQKVLLNLLRNGVESMKERGLSAGIITVTTRRCPGDPTLAQMTVCDCGIGVADAATLKTMFQPFYTTKAAGLGMGLAISRALIEAHGGALWAEANAGPGLSIHVTLPFAP